MVSGLKRTPGRDAAPCKHLGELGGDGIAAGGGGGGRPEDDSPHPPN